MSCWSPPPKGVSMTRFCMEDLLPHVLLAYKFHTLEKDMPPLGMVTLHARKLLRVIHSKREMVRLAWAVSKAVMCGEHPYPPPKHHMWKHDFTVMEALVMMIKEDMDKKGPVYYNGEDAALLFETIWDSRG